MMRGKSAAARRIPAVILILAIVTGGCASSKKQKPEPSAAAVAESENYSAADEMAAGEQIHAEILSTFYPYTDPKVTEYITGIGRKLAAHAGRQDFPYRFTLLYSDKIYATSSPGGYVYLTTGMIYFLDNEAELAGVMAHEIGQLQYRDPRLSHAGEMLEHITRAAAVTAPAFGGLGILAVIGLAAIHAQVTPDEKSAEQRLAEADRFALNYLVEAGYDPQGFIDLQEKFLRAKDDLLPYFYDYYQSRPITQDRWLALKNSFSLLPLEGKELSAYPREFQETTRGIREIYKRPA